MELVFDIETDGLLPQMTKIHCIVAINPNTGEVFKFGPDRIKEGVAMLEVADRVIGHSIATFDIPAIRKLYPTFAVKASLDTLVMSRLQQPDIKAEDFQLRMNKMPKALIGKHSLEAWGWRLGKLKGDFGKTTDWAEYSEEMLAYCVQDVEVTVELYKHLDQLRLRYGCSEGSYKIEEAFALRVQEMMARGVAFDKVAADRLAQVLMEAQAVNDLEVRGLCADFEDEYRTPKKQILKVRKTVFNPSSRDHIARHLIDRRGWVPKDFTETGKPQVDEDILMPLEWPEAKLLAKRFLLEKRMGQLATGKEAWMKAVKEDGRIHGYVNHNGAVTGRCTHSGPNMAQVPRVSSLYGKECRALFVAKPGYKMVGCDAKGLELRCLAHYVAKYDDGAYGRIVCEGDPHTVNQKAAGLSTRDQAKTFIYALLYGAGDAKLGRIVDPKATEEVARKMGRKLRSQFMRNFPAYAALKDGLDARLEGQRAPVIKGIDGRPLFIRSTHAALNTLLQSAGAVLMKRATEIACGEIAAQGIDGGMVLHVHDEFQFEVREDQAETVKAFLPGCIESAGCNLGFRVPMTGDAKVGNNWAETH